MGCYLLCTWQCAIDFETKVISLIKSRDHNNWSNQLIKFRQSVMKIDMAWIDSVYRSMCMCAIHLHTSYGIRMPAHVSYVGNWQNWSVSEYYLFKLTTKRKTKRTKVKRKETWHEWKEKKRKIKTNATATADGNEIHLEMADGMDMTMYNYYNLYKTTTEKT